MSGLRLVFAGSPAAAVPSLKSLAGSQHDIAVVITREDSAQGRKRMMTQTQVAAAAQELGLQTLKANRLSEDVTESVARLQPDLGIIVAYGGLVREPLLSVPRLGWINLHFSLLPRWRGAAPVQRSIMAGDEITGATVFQLVGELDAGDIFGQFTQTIGPTENAGRLLASLSVGGADLLRRVVDAIGAATARAEPQRGDVTIAPKLSVEDGRIDFSAAASTVDCLIRGVTPEPGASFSLGGARIKVLEAAIAKDCPRLPEGTIEAAGPRVLVGTATEPIELLTVHPSGKRSMPAGDWWRGVSKAEILVVD